jgi:hypothetical protein
MPWNAQDRKRYEDEVLAGARVGGVPEDLFTRYGIDARLERRLRDDPAAFDEHVAAVCTYWRGLQSRRRALKKVLVDLVAAHERLDREGRLTDRHFQRVRQEAAARGRREWDDLAGSLTTTVMDRGTLRSMIGAVNIPEPDAERVLREKGVRVVERLPDLPSSPPIRTFRTLRDNLRTRGVDFSPMVVFGEDRLAQGFTVLDGFRLKGGSGERTLSDAALAAAVRRIQVEAMTDGKSAAENALSILRANGDRALRDAIVLWEIISDLRERPSAISESGLARPWVRLGLDEQEAVLLAAAVRGGDTGADPAAQAEQDVRGLLADNQLRQAQAAAVDLPADHDLHAQLRERVRQVDGLTREAERCLRADRREDAARALAAAADVAADDDALAARLGEVVPLPPRGATARVDGHHVVVAWQASASLAGVITYRVTRRTGRGGTTRDTLVGEVSGTEVTDDGIPVGSEARYTVSAVRGGRGVSESVSTSAVMITPDVGDLRVSAGERSVSGSWRVPPEAVRVEVLRGEGAPPRGLGDGVRVDNDGTGFHDTSVRPDAEYYYRVRAVYLTSNGHTRGSTGLVRRAGPGRRPAPVRDLSVHAGGGTGFLASWTPPPRGRVSLRVGAGPPAWPAGTVVEADQVSVFGHEVLQEPTPAADGRVRLELALAPGANHVLPVTVVGDQAVVGEQVRVTAAPPARDLRAERYDTVVRVSWTWPDNAATAVVSWVPEGAEPAGGTRCTRRAYDAEGGFEAVMGAGTVRVSVAIVVASGADEAMSASASVTVPGRPVLAYRVAAAGLLRRERVVSVTAEHGCDMPEIAVVYAAGAVQPHSADQGRVLATLPAGRLTAGETVSVRVQPPRAPRPAWLMCFPLGADVRGVRLRQPSVKELRL